MLAGLGIDTSVSMVPPFVEAVLAELGVQDEALADVARKQ